MAQQLTSTEVNRCVTLREEEHSQLYVAKELMVVQEMCGSFRNDTEKQVP
jgi:hypothetical protein